VILSVDPVHSQAQGPVIFTQEEEHVGVEVAFSNEEGAVLVVEASFHRQEGTVDVAEHPFAVEQLVNGKEDIDLQRRT
jgi:hypothetical protein